MKQILTFFCFISLSFAYHLGFNYQYSFNDLKNNQEANITLKFNDPIQAKYLINNGEEYSSLTYFGRYNNFSYGLQKDFKINNGYLVNNSLINGFNYTQKTAFGIFDLFNNQHLTSFLLNINDTYKIGGSGFDKAVNVSNMFLSSLFKIYNNNIDLGFGVIGNENINNSYFFGNFKGGFENSYNLFNVNVFFKKNLADANNINKPSGFPFISAIDSNLFNSYFNKDDFILYANTGYNIFFNDITLFSNAGIFFNQSLIGVYSIGFNYTGFYNIIVSLAYNYDKTPQYSYNDALTNYVLFSIKLTGGI